MKNFKKLLLIFIVLPCFFLISGCSFLQEKQVFITQIVQTEVDNNTTTYTIYYSNGTTSTITTKNSNENYVTNIKATETIGNKSTYTIYYSDNTSSLFTVTDGENGKDGENLNLESIEEYCELNNINFESFLKKYLTIVQTDSPSVQDASNLALQSAVTIRCEFPTSTYMGTNKNTSMACGAGVIYKMEETFSYIITNYHVVYMYDCDTDNDIASKIHIFQYGANEMAYTSKTQNPNGTTSTDLDENGYPIIKYGNGAVEATYVGGELTYDIAVIKVPTAKLLENNPNAKPVSIANGYEVAETAIAIGNPEAEGFSVTSGIVSVESEDLEMKGADDKTPCTFRVIRIDTAVNGGNSGGGLFNIYGELIGIVNAKIIDSKIDNIAYALPYDNVTSVADNIIHYYDGTNISTLKKLYLGISFSVENSHSVYNPETNRTTIYDDLVVKSIEKNSVAEMIQLEVGDIIKTISINGVVHTISRAHQLPDLLLTIRAGDKIIFEVKREGESKLKELGITNSNGVLESYLKTIKEINQQKNHQLNGDFFNKFFLIPLAN